MDTPTTAAASAPPAVEATRWIAVACVAALIVLSVAWELWLAPTGSGALALKALPWCIPLAGLLRRRLYTYRWVSLMVWPYFAEGAVRAGDGGRVSVLAALEIVLCLALFAACAVHVRLRLKKS
jgi:uncharacterized membrane protein